jgi:hypothetical protein
MVIPQDGMDKTCQETTEWHIATFMSVNRGWDKAHEEGQEKCSISYLKYFVFSAISSKNFG